MTDRSAIHADQQPEVVSRPERRVPLWLTAAVAIGLSLVWVGLSLLMAPLAPGGFRDFFISPTHALLRVALPMGLTGALLLAFLALTGRVKPQLWREGPDVPQAPMWMKIMMVIPIGVALFGIGRRMMEIGERGLTMIAAMLVAVALVGVTEELVYRGFVLQEGRHHLGSEVKAVAFSMVLFGAWHIPNLLLGAPAFGVLTQFFITMVIGGLILYGVRRVTRRLWPAMVAHALWDFAVIS